MQSTSWSSPPIAPLNVVIEGQALPRLEPLGSGQLQLGARKHDYSLCLFKSMPDAHIFDYYAFRYHVRLQF